MIGQMDRDPVNGSQGRGHHLSLVVCVRPGGFQVIQIIHCCKEGDQAGVPAIPALPPGSATLWDGVKGLAPCS